MRDLVRTKYPPAGLTANFRQRLTYPHIVSTLALAVAIVGAALAISNDGDATEQPDGGTTTQAQAPPETGQRAFTAANPDVSTVNTDGITQVATPVATAADGGTYLVTGAVRVNDVDGTSGGDSVVDCRLVRNPETTFIDGRSVRLIDSGALEAPEVQDIAMNGVTELSEGQLIEMICAQEAGSGEGEASVDSARLTYTRVSP